MSNIGTLRQGSMPGERRGGRQKGTPNKATAGIKALAQSFGPAAVRELARIARESEQDTARVSAIRELLDRGFGRSQQNLTVDGEVGISLTVVKFYANASADESNLIAEEGDYPPQQLDSTSVSNAAVVRFGAGKPLC